jgi:hypothetical protein
MLRCIGFLLFHRHRSKRNEREDAEAIAGAAPTALVELERGDLQPVNYPYGLMPYGSARK